MTDAHYTIYISENTENGAGGRIRTGELLRERILSPPPLTRLGNSSVIDGKRCFVDKVMVGW